MNDAHGIEYLPTYKGSIAVPGDQSPPSLPSQKTIAMQVCRERRSWTAKEDQLLREAVDIGLLPLPSPTITQAAHLSFHRGS